MGINAADDFALHLTTALGQTVYVGRAPVVPHAVLSVMLAPDSMGPEWQLGGHQGWDQPSLSITSRANDYAAAYALIKQVYLLLVAQQAGNVDGVRWLVVETVNQPIELTRDDNDKMRFSLSVRGWRTL
jgi:hypothetical protein